MMYLKEEPHMFKSMFQIEKQPFVNTARSLVKRGVLKPMYLVSPRLPTLATIAHGEPKSIISLANALLAGSSTCTAFVCNNGTDGVFLSRIPLSDLGELATSLPQAEKENGIAIRCLRPRILRSYNHTIFQRILKDDGTWDDDVSGFLSQARSKRIEIAREREE